MKENASVNSREKRRVFNSESIFVPVIFIVLSSIFSFVVICVIWDVYRTNRNYRRRKEAEQEAELLWHKGPPMMYPEPPKANPKADKPPAARPTSKPVTVPAVPAAAPAPQQNGGKQIRFQGQNLDDMPFTPRINFLLFDAATGQMPFCRFPRFPLPSALSREASRADGGQQYCMFVLSIIS